MSPQKESFQMYESYCQNKPRSEALWRQFSDCTFFQVSFTIISTPITYIFSITVSHITMFFCCSKLSDML